MFKQKEILKRIDDLEAKQEQLMTLMEKMNKTQDIVYDNTISTKHDLEVLQEKCDDLNIDDDRIKRAVKKAMAEYREEMEAPKKPAKKK